MPPGIVGGHAVGEDRELVVHAREIVEVGRVHPRRDLADADALVGAPRVGKVQRGVAGLERQPELGDELDVGGLPFGGQFAAELNGPALGEEDGTAGMRGCRAQSAC